MLRARSTLEKFAPLEVAFRRGPVKTWSSFEIWQIYRPRSTGIRVNCEVSPPVPCCVDGYKLHSGVTLPSPTISWSSSPSLAVAAAADLVSLKRVSHKTAWQVSFDWSTLAFVDAALLLFGSHDSRIAASQLLFYRLLFTERKCIDQTITSGPICLWRRVWPYRSIWWNHELLFLPRE